MSSNSSIFYLFNEFAHGFAEWANEYEVFHHYASDDDDIMIKIMTFKDERKFGYFDHSKLYKILNAAESGATEDVALAKSIILEMVNLDWNWREDWEQTEGLGFNVGALDLTPKQAEIAERVNEDDITIDEMFAEFGI